jgi:hypothetical protein
MVVADYTAARNGSLYQKLSGGGVVIVTKGGVK